MIDKPFGMDDEELDSLLATVPEGEPLDPQALAQVDCDRKMRRYKARAEQVVELQRHYEAERVRLDAYRDNRVRALRREMMWLGYSLEAEARAQAQAGGPKKFPTAWGYVQLRAAKTSLHVEDEQAAIDWLKENGWERYVSSRPVLAKADLKVSLEAEELEAVPGVSLVRPAQDTVTIRPALGENEWVIVKKVLDAKDD